MIREIYRQLVTFGMTHAGALGVMGNLQAESGCESCRLQGDYELSRSKSKAYAAKVDSGLMIKHIFMYDACGWGLAQWTYFSRKSALYDYCKQSGASIADLTAQLSFLAKELREYYPNLWTFLCSTNDMYAATKRVCEEFERPAVNNVGARYLMAQTIESELSKETTEPEPTEESYWPPRTVDRNMAGPDIFALQGVLCARGYYKNEMSGRFDGSLEAAVKQFQKDSKLSADGICGPLTWAALVKL